MTSERPGLTASVFVTEIDGEHKRQRADDLAVEEPLEIRVSVASQTRNLAVTMRTPGRDFELAAGFLYSEGVISNIEETAQISYCVDPAVDAEQRYNIVTVELAASALPELQRFARHFTINSSCGVCGKASIESLKTRATPIGDGVRVRAALVASLPDRMREQQRVFQSTGGLHAVALFNTDGDLLALREDVGRHNAFDKIAGWALMEKRLPLAGCVAVVSGRASYELLQKAIAAGIPILCAVSAPSSLAVELARAFNVTLCGFVRGQRFNVYTAPERILLARSG